MILRNNLPGTLVGLYTVWRWGGKRRRAGCGFCRERGAALSRLGFDLLLDLICEPLVFFGLLYQSRFHIRRSGDGNQPP